MSGLIEDWQNGGFGIYVHWPFCTAKCPYCDFNSHVRKEVDQQRWADALCTELTNASYRTGGRKVDSVFYGGGTPSLMSPETVNTILEHVRSLWPTSNEIEITLEANPTSVEAEKFHGFHQSGVNRLSMGIQALNDIDLKRLGRMHTASEAKHAFDVAKKYFDRVSFDLIYARQDQSIEAWKNELNEAASMAIDHLSMYQLTIEPETRFGELFERGNLSGLPSDTLAADMYEATIEQTIKMGMPAYEISNHAIPGSESKHNLIYWRYGDYVGVGPGAHGRITENGNRIATISIKNPERWIAAVEANGTASSDNEIIDPVDQASEYLMMSFRLSEGSDINRFNALSNTRLNVQGIEKNKELGFLTITHDRIAATDNGKMILNTLLKDLLV